MSTEHGYTGSDGMELKGNEQGNKRKKKRERKTRCERQGDTQAKIGLGGRSGRDCQAFAVRALAVVVVVVTRRGTETIQIVARVKQPYKQLSTTLGPQPS